MRALGTLRRPVLDLDAGIAWVRHTSRIASGLMDEAGQHRGTGPGLPGAQMQWSEANIRACPSDRLKRLFTSF